MLDRAFFVVLVLNATGLFRFVAPQVGASIGQVSQALLAFNLLYLFMRLPCLLSIFPKMRAWFALFLLWPLATMAYAPSTEIREIGIALYGFTLLAATVVYTVSNGLPAIRRVFQISLILTIFGQILNMAMPGYFEAVATLAHASVLKDGRPGGFFLQSNNLAVSLVFLFIGWLALAKRDTTFREPIMILGLIGCVLLTGSRTGMVLCVLVVGLHVTYQWRESLFRSQKVRFFSARLAILAGCLFFGMIGAKFFIEVYGDQVQRHPGDLIDRMSRLMEFQLSDDENLLQDTSLRERFIKQAIYWDLIKQKPYLGHGLGAGTFYSESSAFALSAHSTILAVTMQYGIAYPMVFSLLFASLILNRRRARVERALGTNSLTQFVLVTLLMFVVGHGFLNGRLFFVIFGMVYIVTYYPWRVFASEPSEQNYTRMLSKGEIRQTQRDRKRSSRPEAVDGLQREVENVKSQEVTET